MLIDSSLNYSHEQKNNESYYSKLWSLDPIDNNDKIKYFDAKIHALNVSTTKTNIKINIQLLVLSKSVLPNGTILAAIDIPEYQEKDIVMLPSSFSYDDLDWKPYEINLTIPKKSLSYGFQNLKDMIVPFQIVFYSNNLILSDIKNEFSSEALKYWLDNLYNTVLSSKIKLDSYFEILDLSGSKKIYEKFSNSDDSSEFINISWNMNYYLRLKGLEQISNLINITASKPLTIIESIYNFYYHVPGTIGYQNLNYRSNKWDSIEANKTKTIKTPFKVLYSNDKKEVFKEEINGHDFLLPNGGNGYYELILEAQSDNSFYSLKITNKFNYIVPFDSENSVDFFDFKYHEINNLNGFLKV